MDNYVKASIDSRKNAVFSLYEIEDKNIQNEIDSLFNRIEEFGSNLDNPTEFEAKFAESDLNTEYINLFTTISTSCKPIEQKKESDESHLKREMKRELGREADRAIIYATDTLKEKTGLDNFAGGILNGIEYSDVIDKFKKDEE